MNAINKDARKCHLKKNNGGDNKIFCGKENFFTMLTTSSLTNQVDLWDNLLSITNYYTWREADKIKIWFAKAMI